jgi:hypothetical protein
MPNRFHKQFAQNDRMQMKNATKNSAHARKMPMTKNHGIMATDMEQRERQRKQRERKERINRIGNVVLSCSAQSLLLTNEKRRLY